MGWVYSNVEKSISVFFAEDFVEAFGIKSPQDVFNNEDLMCICVVASLLSVSVLGVFQAVTLKDAIFPSENTLTSPWCVQTSRTANSCCRLYKYLKSTYQSYNIDFAENLNSSHISTAGKSLLYSFMPWDIRMVCTHNLYLPRPCCEYYRLDKYPGENAFDNDDYFLSEFFRKVLSKGDVYLRLRAVRHLIYDQMNQCEIMLEKDDFVEILRDGCNLRVDYVSATAETCNSTFLCLVTRSSVSDLVKTFRKGDFEKSFVGCENCTLCFNVRCIQLKTLASLLKIALDVSGEDESSNIVSHSMQISTAIMMAKYCCMDLMRCSCSCSCSLSHLGLVALPQFTGETCSSRITVVDMQNLWSAVEVGVLHTAYLMFCILANEYKQLNGPIKSNDYLQMIIRMVQFPLESLDPELFGNIFCHVLSENTIYSVNEIMTRIEQYNWFDFSVEHTKDILDQFLRVVMSVD